MNRDERDKDVAVRETKRLQEDFENRVKRLSFDRGFHSPESQIGQSEQVDQVCLPKPGPKQSAVQLAAANDEFLAARQSHSGVESVIGTLQSGNAMKRCRDHSEFGLERYKQLAMLGRNLHTLGRLLIARENGSSAAARTQRKAACASSPPKKSTCHWDERARRKKYSHRNCAKRTGVLKPQQATTQSSLQNACATLRQIQKKLTCGTNTR